MPDIVAAECPCCSSHTVTLVQRLCNGGRIFFCRQCFHGYRWPPKTESELCAYYTSTYYAGHMKDFDTDRLRVYEIDFRKASRGLKKGAVLDFGCGFGHFLKYAGDLGWQTFGLDMAQQAVAVARDELHLDVKRGGADMIRSWARPFDLVTLWNVLDHLADPAGALREIHAALADNGRIVLRIHNFGVRKWLYRLSAVLRVPFLTKNFGFFLDSCFTGSSVRRMLKRCGFRDVIIRNSSLAGDVKGLHFGRTTLGLLQCCLAAIYYCTFTRACLGPSLLVTAEKAAVPPA